MSRFQEMSEPTTRAVEMVSALLAVKAGGQCSFLVGPLTHDA